MPKINAEAVAILREINIRKARESFWAYCCLLSPDFYRSDRWHLWIMCETLQALYERRLTKALFWDICHAPNVPAWFSETVDWERLKDGITYTRLMQNLPPRHGKSRTLVNFCDWILGKDTLNRIITVSYNTDLAADMSRYVRDGIAMKKNMPTQIVYNDIFPNSKIARGNSSFMKWALEGCFFNYLGAGLEGTITGKGSNCLAGGTLVMTDKGEVAIEQICSNKDDYLVLSVDQKSGRIVLRKILATRRSTRNELIKFKTKHNRKITCTKEHRFFDGRGFRFAKDFRKGDFFYAIKEQEKQNLRYLWEGKNGERTYLRRLLQEAKGFANKNKMRSLWGNFLQANARLSQSNVEKCNWKDILLIDLREFSTKISKSWEMLCLRRTVKTWKEILFSKMSGYWRKRNSQKATRQNLSSMRDRVQTDEPFNEVLFKRLCKQGTFIANEWRGKPRLQERDELCERISGNEADNFSKRQPYLYDMRKNGEKNNCEMEGKRCHENKSDLPSYRRRCDKQSLRKSNYGMQHLSPAYSQIEEDEITRIEIISGKPQYVYDIQVEETGNFFACTLLTHNCSIIDDPVKNAEEAYNDKTLSSIWNWYTGTFLSRSEKEGNGSIDIVNHTRWNTNDLCGRILGSKMGEKWLILSMPVEHNGVMLCKSILPHEDFCDLRDNMDENIFLANYYQEPVDIKGRLFEYILTYDELPDGIEKVIAYIDTADEGTDYLACIMGGVKDGEGYITDIYFTQASMNVTEPETAKRLVINKVNHAKIESNNGGRGFARNVEEHIWKDFHTRDVDITWFHQTENKMSRILTGASFVMKHVYFPKNWDKLWPEFYLSIMSFQKTGGNKHDDGAEALVEWGKMITGDGSINSYIEMMKKMKEGRKHDKNY